MGEVLTKPESLTLVGAMIIAIIWLVREKKVDKDEANAEKKELTEYARDLTQQTLTLLVEVSAFINREEQRDADHKAEWEKFHTKLDEIKLLIATKIPGGENEVT